MAGSHKPAIWQVRMKIYIDTRLQETNLGDRLNAIRESSTDDESLQLSTLMLEYSLPLNSHRLLLNYLATGLWDYGLVEPSVKIVSYNERIIIPSDKPHELYALVERLRKNDGDSAVYLRIDKSLQKNELKAFIDDNWHEVESRLHSDGYLTPRMRNKQMAIRDKRIMELYTLGMSFIQILEMIDNEFPAPTPLTVENIRVIVGNNKHKSKK